MTQNPKPRWANVAHNLINASAASKIHREDYAVTENHFLQTWHAKEKEGYTLIPPSIKRILKVAKKYNLTVDGIEINEETKKAMPIWYHHSLMNTRIAPVTK